MEDLVAAVRAALRGTAQDKARVLMQIDLDVVRAVSHSSFVERPGSVVVSTGIGASHGAASGEIVLRAEDAIAAADSGRSVILVRPETTPDDVVGMQVAAGILTSRGGVASHAAVVARGWGIPAVVGAADVVIDGDIVRMAGRSYAAGDTISIDGTSGHIYEGLLTVTFDAPPEEISQLHAWSQRVTSGRVTFRANADNANDALHARSLGAEGIGLCRTEHMFLSADRLPLIRTFILSEEDSVESEEALGALEEAQVSDFVQLFRAMNGMPVTVRLLDPPLHEFLPPMEPIVVAEGRDELDSDGRRLLAAIRRLHESNPMIGTRGIRLAVVRQGLYQMQVRAIARAAGECAREGSPALVEIMIPLVSDEREMALARAWVEETWRLVAPIELPTPSIGAMIETPRAALIADRIADHAEFLSFGTNDLTQLTYGLSRDDVEVGLIPAYLDKHIFDSNPFSTLDSDGVGALIEMACIRSRSRQPDIRIGACGEHAGDPHSIEILLARGVTSLSCSPPRIPLARLAAARVLLATGSVEADVLGDDTMSFSSVPHSNLGRRSSEIDGAAPTLADVIHVLRIRGFADVRGVADSLVRDVEGVQSLLSELVATGMARLFEARGIYQLTPLGVEEHESLLEVLLRPESRSLVRDLYEEFLILNSQFKDLCTSWQIRDGQPNQHDDVNYDSGCIGTLEELVAATQGVLHGLSSPMPGFDRYSRRLEHALKRLIDGDRSMFTGVACGSVHDIWMEIHEDLIRVLGVDRVAEGSF